MDGAIIYARFSPRPDADESLSIETQLDWCRSYCAQKGYSVIGEYCDRAVSGSDEDRPVLWDAVTALRRGQVLVVHKQDRLARNLYLSEYIYRRVADKPARIECVTGSDNSGTAEARLLRQVMAAFAEYERHLIAARTRASMLALQAQGRRMSKILPYGWKADPRDPKKMLKDPREQSLIARVVAEYQAGAKLREISEGLNISEIPCRGGKWHHTLVRRILYRWQREHGAITPV